MVYKATDLFFLDAPCRHTSYYLLLVTSIGCQIRSIYSLDSAKCISTVNATNLTTGTSDNGSVLYEAIYSQAYLQGNHVGIEYSQVFVVVEFENLHEGLENASN